jgi:pyridoxamine 5'-phosphate oxidase
MRKAYALGGLSEAELATDPMTQFGRWFDEAVTAGLPEPNAMVLATCSRSSGPSARIVLLKEYDEAGFTFFTNGRSRKGVDLAENPRAALLFPWHGMERQVRVEGPVQVLDRAMTERYFRTRPRGSQLGAWASDQSQVIGDRADLEARAHAASERWPAATPVPLPDAWTGYRVVLETIEFWQGRDNRLHDRRAMAGGAWLIERLAP